MKKIGIVGTVGLPAQYGGFETLTEYLAKELSEKYDITVFCSSKSYKEKIEYYKGTRLKYINFDANGISSIPYDIISIFKSLKFADTILILGVSGCICLPIIKLFRKKRIVVNIDGLEWKREKWGNFAKWFLRLSEKMAIQYANVVIADNIAIKNYVKNEYGVHSELIAYGSDHVKREELSDELLGKYPFLNNPYAFKVCRIEPENNIHIILEAFKEYNALNLVIVGNWKNSKYGVELKERYKNCENIFLLDAIYDQNILNQIRSNCYVYIHGHSAGGTNPSLVEAMYLGLPIIAYGVEYNLETTKYKAKYFKNKMELQNTLSNITENELQIISKDMSEIAKKYYNWKLIAEQYAKLF